MIKHENTNIVNSIEKEAYYSSEENRIYKSSQIALFSTSVAKELSKLFGLGAEEAFPLLDSFLNTSTEDELDEKLKYFNIQLEDLSKKETREEIRLKSLAEQQGQEVAEGVKREEPEPQEDISIGRPQLPDVKSIPEEHDLIDPNEFIFDVIEEHIPYMKTDGIPEIPVKEIKLREGHRGGQQRDGQFKERAMRIDAEGLALEIVQRFEEIEGKEPDDRHKQRKIGYDIFSSIKDEDDKRQFIEVKHFRGEPGTWELDHYQWKKAEQEGDRYFVYVVSGLRKGMIPKIQIIQNPIKYLVPDPPIKKSFSDWNGGIARLVKCQKV